MQWNIKMYPNNPRVAMKVEQRNRKAERMSRKQILKW